MSSDTFHLFRRLPYELRQQIWKLAVPESRLVDIHTVVKDKNDDSDAESAWYCVIVSSELETGFINPKLRSSDLPSVVDHTVQAQLEKYGFTSSHPQPYLTSDTCLSSDAPFFGQRIGKDGRGPFYCICETTAGSRQSQLTAFGFTSAEPSPIVKYLTYEDWRTLFHPNEICEHRSSTSAPPLLYVCQESRNIMKSLGYELAFRSHCLPKQIWFNFSTDFLYLYLDEQKFCNPWKVAEGHMHIWHFRDEDIRRTKRLALKFPYLEDVHVAIAQIVKTFGNLEELHIVMSDSDESLDLYTNGTRDLGNEPDLVFVDCAVPDIFLKAAQFPMWVTASAISISLERYLMTDKTGVGYFTYWLQALTKYFEDEVARDMELGRDCWVIPKVRCGSIMPPASVPNFHRLRQEWQQEWRQEVQKITYEGGPHPDESIWRPRSPFEILYAEDIEEFEAINSSGNYMNEHGLYMERAVRHWVNLSVLLHTSGDIL